MVDESIGGLYFLPTFECLEIFTIKVKKKSNTQIKRFSSISTKNGLYNNTDFWGEMQGMSPQPLEQ